MTDPEAMRNVRMTQRWLRVQSLVSVALAVALLAVDQVAAYSSMFGSLAVFLPALLFATLVAPRFGSDSAAFLRAAALGEVGKLLLIAVLCIATFVWVEPLAAGWFFAGMLVTMAAGWSGLIFS
jgi:ATP synthase protein I